MSYYNGNQSFNDQTPLNPGSSTPGSQNAYLPPQNQYQQPPQQQQPYYQPPSTEMGALPPDTNKDAPPMYASPTPSPAQPAQPYYEQPTIPTVQTPTVTLTTTTPLTMTTIPQYPYIPGVIDVVPTIPMISEINRDLLRQVGTMPYTHEIFEADRNKSNCCTCGAGICSITGLLAAGGITAFVVVTITKGFGPQIIAVPFSAVLLIAYLITWVFATAICCSCCSENCDQGCLATPYYTTICRNRNRDASGPIQECIEQLQTDIPQLVFHVRCSHSTGSGKNRRTVVTYNQDHVVPVLHSKFAGVDAKTFLSSLDDYTSGDLVLQFVPKFVLHPDQSDIIPRFRDLVYQANRHRDTTTIVTPTLRSTNLNPNPKYSKPGIAMTDTITYQQKVHHDDTSSDDSDDDKEEHMKKKSKKDKNGQTEGTMLLSLSTSLGPHTEVYRSNGRTANCCLRLVTHPFVWALGVLTCWTPFLLCCWHARYDQARYHATFHVLFPRYETFAGAYQNNIDSFLYAPPVVQQPQLPPNQSPQQPQQQQGGYYQQ